MTRTPTNRSPREPKLFDCRPGSDGTELTFDIVYLPTEMTIAATTYWYAEANAKRIAQAMVRALNSFYDQGGYIYSKEWQAVGDMIDGSRRSVTVKPDGSPHDDYTLMAREAERMAELLDPTVDAECRTRWAGHLFKKFHETAQLHPANALADLLTDMMHWSTAFGGDFEDACQGARNNFDPTVQRGGSL